MTSKNILKLLIVLSVIIVASAIIAVFIFNKQNSLVNQENLSLISNNTKEEVTKTIKENVSSEEITTKLPGCKIAFSPEIYIKDVIIKEDFKNLLRDYRKHWQDLCSGKAEHSLYSLWVEAKNISKLTLEDYIDYPLAVDPNKVYEYSDVFSSFVPGLVGIYAEGWWLAVQPSIKLFAQNVALGTSEDKDFFTMYPQYYLHEGSAFTLWKEPTWDYGGCTTYGKYDWVSTLKSLDELSKKINSPSYSEDIYFFRKSLLSSVTNNNKITDSTYIIDTQKICTCDKKEAVKNDLEKVLLYAQSSHIYNDTVSFIKESLDKVKDGRIKVFSETEQHCSGG